MIFKMIAIIVLTILFFLFLKKEKMEWESYKKAKQKFVKHLKKIHDTETLKQLGQINPFGVYEEWNVSTRKIKKRLESRFTRDDEEDENEFKLALDKYEKKGTPYQIIMSLCLYGIINILILIFGKR